MRFWSRKVMMELKLDWYLLGKKERKGFNSARWGNFLLNEISTKFVLTHIMMFEQIEET